MKPLWDSCSSRSSVRQRQSCAAAVTGAAGFSCWFLEKVMLEAYLPLEFMSAMRLCSLDVALNMP